MQAGFGLRDPLLSYRTYVQHPPDLLDEDIINIRRHDAKPVIVKNALSKAFPSHHAKA